MVSVLERILEKEEEQKKLREKQETLLERLWMMMMVSDLRKDHELQIKSLRAELQRQPAPFDEVKKSFLCLEASKFRVLILCSCSRQDCESIHISELPHNNNNKTKN